MEVVKDPVCGMIFVREDAAGQTLYKSETYYFCAPSCKKSFDKDPEKYLATLNDSHGSRERDEKDNGLREHD